MFYYFWDMVFLNLITWAGTDMFSTGLTQSVSILKAMSWTSFLLMYIAVCPLYLFYTIIVGARNDVQTEPIELLKGVGIWAITMPIVIFILGLMYFLITTLSGATSGLMDATSLGFADDFAWLLTLIAITGASVYPFIFIIKGYGIKMLEGEVDERIR